MMTMEQKELSLDYITAEGPEGLKQVLYNLLDLRQKNPDKAELEQYILYQLGNQKSLIKVDISEQPFQFWYYDLLGRPATKIVKDVIADFVWEKGGEKERYMQELAARDEQ
jgi:hypothetical protein